MAPPQRTPWTINVKQHPGSSAEEISNEPDWGAGHNHRVGFRNRDGRVAGVTHQESEYDAEIEEARKDLEYLRNEARKGDLINFREVIQHQKDFHLRHPENRSLGWRYVLDTTEDWIKRQEKWPANIREREKKDGQEKDMSSNKDAGGKDINSKDQNEEYSSSKDQGPDSDPEEEHYTPEEKALSVALKADGDLASQMRQTDGKRRTSQTRNRTQISIDEQDQFGPDNWLPRSPDLIRLTGKHPLNAEAKLDRLFAAGIITPNELHYVRNHGAVPRLLWEMHTLYIEHDGTTTTLTMKELKTSYESINIPVVLACDGNRRKELNMIKKTSGFNWGAGAVSCAYWKGPLLRDVLLSADVPESISLGDGKGGRKADGSSKRYWVNFEGADEPSEGKYSTCIPFEYAMDSTNDVMLAYEMNDLPLPPDHGYPVRLLIPGYVGGRCVKWLRRIWISDRENDSHYHIWDNRVLPSVVTNKSTALAEALFRHPDTACNEQSLNSVIARPAQGERLPLRNVRKGDTYRVAGYAYAGGGHKVQRVELSLDGGKTWLYCVRRFPDDSIRHGNKFWSWLHWHVDVEVAHLVRADSISVRCFDVFKNTQPRDPNWNIMGMMNNCWYVVRMEIVEKSDDNDYDNDSGGGGSGGPELLFRHPVEPGTGGDGWVKPSVQNRIAEAKQEAVTPRKEFTREEIEKHSNEDDCWIVVDGKVYDVSSVLAWHPGGKAAILSHVGKVHQDTTDEFASIHDDYAYGRLKECIIGIVTEKAATFIKKNAEAEALSKANSKGDSGHALQKHRWVPVRLESREELSEDTRKYTFRLPEGQSTLGLGTCEHVQIGFHMKDKLLIRSYTPTRPLLPARKNSGDNGQSMSPSKSGENLKTASSNSKGHNGSGENRARGSAANTTELDASLYDGNGTFDLTVKTYFPDANQPGGAMSNILDCIPVGEEVEIRGPTGDIRYEGGGRFVIEGRARVFRRVSLVLGGSGITPGYALVARVLLSQDPGDATELRVIDSNKSEVDILLRGELDRLERRSSGQLRVTHVLSHPGEGWEGVKGHVSEELIKKTLFPPGKENVVFVCGPPAMIQNTVLPALRNWDYVDEENMFGF